MNAGHFHNLSICKQNRRQYIGAIKFTNLHEDTMMFHKKLFDETEVREHKVLAQQKLYLLQLFSQ